MRYVILLALFATLVRADDDPEVRFLKAWYAMGEPDKAAAAEETFRALLEAAGTPADLKARCLLGLAECARLRGDEAKAREFLERVVADHGATDAAERARRLLGGSGYLDWIRLVPRGRYLDLDDGSVSEERSPAPGKEAEMRDWNLLVEATADTDFAAKVVASSSNPWRRVRTSGGRTSWVQTLETQGCTVVRVVTRRSGVGDVLPAPHGAFCLGGEKGIEIHFEPSRGFARYRIERGADHGEPVEVGQVTGSPFLDASAEEGVRYLYRIVGETADGGLGLAATLEATRQSRGVVSGVAELSRGDAGSFDFLLGKVVKEGDLTLHGTYGRQGGASFLDAFGRIYLSVAPPTGTATPWDAARGAHQVTPGQVFLVPLRGGGGARCRLELPKGDGGPEAILHYEACGDAAALPIPVRLEATPDERGAIVKVAVDPPYRVDRVEAFDVVAGTALAPLEVKDGIARDPSATEGQIREYRAVAVDPLGRRSAAATVQLRRFPDGPRSGEFRFHYEQGYSLETGQIVPADQADVVFSSCAGGISSITLSAPGGIVNLEGILPRDLDPGTPRAIFGLVLRADPQIPLRKDASGDDREPASDVFLLKTRHGGWAKLVITHRGREGGWTEHLATVQYVVNFNEPVFGQGEGEAIRGISFGDLQPLKARAEILKRWQEGWRQIALNPPQRPVPEEEAREEGTMPDPATTQEVLLSRQRYRDYEKATFNFVFGVRDDPDRKQTRNDWCLQYGNGGDTFTVRMVTDDKSTITDLGLDDWKGIAGRKQLSEGGGEGVLARCGRVYLVHTLDTDENFFSLLRVTAIRPGDMVAFEWISLREDRLGRSPGLVLDKPAEAALTALLAALPKAPDARWTEAEKALRERLSQPELRIGVTEADPADLLRDLGLVTGVPFTLKAKAPPKVTLFSARLTPQGVLDAVSEQTGLHWRVEKDGSVTLE